jgi:hypothetical protein
MPNLGDDLSVAQRVPALSECESSEQVIEARRSGGTLAPYQAH